MKTWHWILIITAILVASIISSLSYISKYEETTRSEYQHASDSLVASHVKETTDLNLKMNHMKEEYNSLISERDSLRIQVYNNTKTNKQLIRTVYKDSIKEVYVENTESVMMYEQTIRQLRDSLAHSNVQQDGVEVKYVTEFIHDTIFVTKTVTDTVHVETKSEVKKQGKIGIYEGADAKYGQDGFNWDAEAGAKYYIIGPVYAKGGIEYSNGLNGVVGAGLDIRF